MNGGRSIDAIARIRIREERRRDWQFCSRSFRLLVVYCILNVTVRRIAFRNRMPSASRVALAGMGHRDRHSPIFGILLSFSVLWRQATLHTNHKVSDISLLTSNSHSFSHLTRHTHTHAMHYLCLIDLPHFY